MKEAIAQAFAIWQTIWRPPVEPNSSMVAVWEQALAGVDEQAFKRAAQEIMSEAQFWPTPKQILDKIKPQALPHYYREFKALPIPEEPPATKEEIKQILDGMTEGGRRIFLAARYGDEVGEVKH